MATKRAQRLEDFLSNKLGWETKSLSWNCVTQQCGFRVFCPQLFCSNCGKKMLKKTDKSEVCNDLERAISYALGEEVRSIGGTTNKPMVLRVDAEEEIKRLFAALATAEVALADIGDADRSPGDDMAWCERRAARALPAVRAALTPHVGVDPVTTVASHALRGPDGEVVKTALTPNG